MRPRLGCGTRKTFVSSPLTVWADTNVLLRIITGDPPKMVEEVRQLAQKVDQGQIVLKIPSIVIAECCWVLESLYGYNPPDIARSLTSIINAKGMDAEEKSLVLEALRDYDQQRVDYIDAYIAAKARSSSHPYVVTWNYKHFSRLRVKHNKPHQVQP